MLNYECPHCRKRGISTWRSMRANGFPVQRLVPITCSECGTEVEATWWSVIWTSAPFVAAFFLAWNFISSTPVFMTVVAAVLLASLWVNSRFVVWTEKR
jgi:hypothetical protein